MGFSWLQSWDSERESLSPSEKGLMYVTVPASEFTAFKRALSANVSGSKCPV